MTAIQTELKKLIGKKMCFNALNEIMLNFNFYNIIINSCNEDIIIEILNCEYIEYTHRHDNKENVNVFFSTNINYEDDDFLIDDDFLKNLNVLKIEIEIQRIEYR